LLTHAGEVEGVWSLPAFFVKFSYRGFARRFTAHRHVRAFATFP